jgi:ATP-binding cassette subfamily A (ABC1) protein 3
LVTSEGIEHFGDSYEHYEKSKAIIDFVDKVYDITKHTEDSKLKEIDMTDKNYVGYYSSLLMLEERNHKYEYVMVLNARIKHCIPIYTHFLSKAIIEKAINHERKIDIKFTHYPLPLTYDIKDERLVGNKYAVVFFLSAALAIMPVNYIYLLVTERVNNSKHLMRISGLNIASYWIVNYIFEIVKYYSTGGICFLLLYVFKFYKNYFYIFYITLGPGLISLTYIMSFFLDESSAQNVVLVVNFIIGNVGAIIIIVIRTVESVKNIGKVLEYIFAIIPSFCFDFSLNLLLNTIGIYFIDYPDEWLSFEPNVIIEKFNLLLSMIIFSSIECVLYTILLFVVESRSYHFKKPTNIKLISDIKDSGVIEEIKNCNKNNNINGDNDNEIINNINDKNQNGNYILRINNLKKIFKDTFCCKSKNKDIIAIKNLNFGIKKGECFGILGLNGAGKTTTFKCITQELSQDNGCIFINEENIVGNFKKLNEIVGYCPQFGAIFENLTVYENLEFYSRIKGIKKDKIDALVNAMIKEMSLDEFKNKESRKLSGGNKRKLSVAISMIGNPPILLLDEPSSGIDPEARRFMWSIIHKMSTKGEKSSTIISTHSMDEAETLCKRIGIMVNGEFVCIGKTNDIKEKYGYGYEINIRIKPIDDNLKEEILKKNNFDNNFLVTEREIEVVLNKIGKKNYLEELKDGRLGERIKKEMYLKGSINICALLNWIFWVDNAFKFIQKGKNYFEEIILVEHFENSFLFKLKRGKDTKSIGFFFGLFEENKEECHVSEYSIQLTSLEQIFNKFTIGQNKIIDVNEEDSFYEENKNIVIDDIFLNNL